MPVYEYECQSCGHRFEELLGSHVGVQAADVRCPSCGADKVNRLISPYATLHRQLTPRQQKRLEAKRGAARRARRTSGG